VKILVSPVPCPTAGGDSGPHHERRLTEKWVFFMGENPCVAGSLPDSRRGFRPTPHRKSSDYEENS
jgi:hypothetical protein